VNEHHVWLAVAVIALVTAGLRFLPFVVFGGGRKTPAIITRLSGVLPSAVMAMLVVYCLRSVQFSGMEGWIPAMVSCLLTAGLHVWRRNTLLSIVGGTVCYMLLVQLVF